MSWSGTRDAQHLGAMLKEEGSYGKLEAHLARSPGDDKDRKTTLVNRC